MHKSELPDPFEKSRLEAGISEINDQDDPVKMVLRYDELRKIAKNYKQFSSEAVPGRIVIPSEVNIRKTRQIPFELDPPKHTAYRAVVESWFRRPMEDAYYEKLVSQIEPLMEELLLKESFEVVEELALVLQSRALTLLLNVPFEESDIWISWGTHVFRSEDTALDADKANILYDYIDKKIKESKEAPKDDLYGLLLKAQVNGKNLTDEEIKGVMVLTFAGGRDTIINAITNAIAYLAEHQESLERLRENPELTGRAVEEMVRYFSPLTQMGRVVTEDTTVCEHAIRADTRVSLCWASANRDESVFENANELVLDRRRNPHVGFGFSHHSCLGAFHTRQLLKAVLLTLTKKVERIEIFDYEDNVEDLGEFKRKVGFHHLKAKFNPLTSSNAD